MRQRDGTAGASLLAQHPGVPRLYGPFDRRCTTPGRLAMPPVPRRRKLGGPFPARPTYGTVSTPLTMSNPDSPATELHSSLSCVNVRFVYAMMLPCRFSATG